jgi:hypothetical protein
MENKTTTELLEELANIKDEDFDTGGKYEEIIAVLKYREPFTNLLNDMYDLSLPAAWEAIQALQEEVKRLKRHKHDEKNGDVLVRI